MDLAWQGLYTSRAGQGLYALCYPATLAPVFWTGITSKWLAKIVQITLWRRKWNESGFRPPLCTFRLNWARRTSWGWWDDWDDTVLQTQDSKFEPWRSEAEHATSRSRRLPTILTFTRGWGRNIFCFFQTAETGNRTPNSGVKGSGANHYPRAPALERRNAQAVMRKLEKKTGSCQILAKTMVIFGSGLYKGLARQRLYTRGRIKRWRHADPQDWRVKKTAIPE